MDKHLAEVDVAALADAQQLGLTVRGVLPWNKPEPCCKVSSLAECCSDPDGSTMCGCPFKDGLSTCRPQKCMAVVEDTPKPVPYLFETATRRSHMMLCQPRVALFSSGLSLCMDAWTVKSEHGVRGHALKPALFTRTRRLSLPIGLGLCHLLIAVCLPERWASLSTLWIGAGALYAAWCVFIVGRRLLKSARVFWYLLAMALILNACTALAEASVETLDVAVSNHASALVVLPSILAMVPLLIAVSSRWNPLLSTAIVKTFLALLAGALFFQVVFGLLTLSGATLQNAQTMVRYMDSADVLLLLTMIFRLAGATGTDEKRFFYVSAVFFGVDTACASVHNHIVLKIDAVSLDLLLIVPYLVLIGMIQQPMPAMLRNYLPSKNLKRVVRGASPVLLCLFVVVPGLLVAREHFARGAVGIIAGVIGYGILNTLIQTHSLASEDELRDARTTLEEMVGVDALTGIANRRAFDRTFSEEWRRAHRKGLPLTLLMVDIDYFKLLNDIYGHPYGDLCLQKVAEGIRRSLARSTDFAARYGGEEFVLLLPQASSSAANIVAERVRSAVQYLGLDHRGSPFECVTVSIGGATSDVCNAQTPAELLKIADTALYQAKRNGRNRAEFVATLPSVAVQNGSQRDAT